MRSKERERNERKFLLVQLLLTVIFPLLVLLVEGSPLIENLLSRSSEHILHRCLDRRALPGPGYGTHRALLVDRRPLPPLGW